MATVVQVKASFILLLAISLQKFFLNQLVDPSFDIFNVGMKVISDGFDSRIDQYSMAHRFLGLHRPYDRSIDGVQPVNLDSMLSLL